MLLQIGADVNVGTKTWGEDLRAALRGLQAHSVALASGRREVSDTKESQEETARIFSAVLLCGGDAKRPAYVFERSSVL